MLLLVFVFFFKQKTADEMRISYWSADVCSSDLVARTSGLSNGEAVEIETLDGDIFIRRRAAKAEARRDAEAAAIEIIAGAKGHSLGGISIRELRDEGRRG